MYTGVTNTTIDRCGTGPSDRADARLTVCSIKLIDLNTIRKQEQSDGHKAIKK